MNKQEAYIKVIRTVALVMAVLLSLLLCMRAEAAEFKGAELEEVSIEYKGFEDGGRDPLFWQSPPTRELNVNINTKLLKYGFINNKVHSMMDTAQFHVVGWNYKVGAHVFPFLDVQYEHFSKHILDGQYPYQRFPVENSFGFTLFMYRDKDKGSIF